MRTKKEITRNLTLLDRLKSGLKVQIGVIDNEYQKIAIEGTGKRCEAFDHMKTHLHDAWHSLNHLWHLELEALDEC